DFHVTGVQTCALPILANKETSKIAYVVHLGDVVDHGDDNNSVEWTRAKNELYKLEQDGIPYGVAVGNHDQTPYGNPASPGTNSEIGRASCREIDEISV